jgi:hypothetical protein
MLWDIKHRIIQIIGTEYETNKSKRDDNGPNRFLNCEIGGHLGCDVDLQNGDRVVHSGKPCSESLNNLINEWEQP